MVQAATDKATSLPPKNVAIIIAVSEYDSAQELPACKLDGQLMATIIKHSGKFSDEDVLTIVTDTTSKNVKQQLATFVRKQLGKPIADLFLYFTGHGEYDDRDFNFVLSNYNPAKRNQTGLSNTELDTMLPTLLPQVAVKVVDACNSGVRYIKDMNVFKRYVDSTTQGFRDCYFMFSSQRDQSSFCHRMSDFTQAIGEALLQHPQEAIRYKDIIDVVSDKFESSGLPQTPCFTTQATFTEHFCNISDTLRNAIKGILNPSITVPAGVVAVGVETLPTKSLKDVLPEN